jgi:hypothetical protein
MIKMNVKILKLEDLVVKVKCPKCKGTMWVALPKTIIKIKNKTKFRFKNDCPLCLRDFKIDIKIQLQMTEIKENDLNE